MMSAKTVAACLGCLVAGVILGRLLPSADPEPTEDPTATADPERSRAAATPARRWDPGFSPEDREPRTGARPAPDEVEGGEGFVHVPVGLIEELSLAAGTRSAGQSLFTGDGKLEEALGIGDREKAGLQTAWRESQREIRQLEAASSKSEELEDGSVRISVPDLSNAMTGVGEGFRTSVRGILGDDRGDVFLAMKQADRLFSAPEGGRTYVVTVEETGAGGWRFRMTQEGADGRRMWVGDSIPDEIRHLTDPARIVPSLESPPAEGEED